MAHDCIFCRITNGEIPCNKVYEDEEILAFEDINPKAPIHYLFIPKKHITSLMDLKEDDIHTITNIITSIQELAKKAGIGQNGFRIVINNGKDAGQEVGHLHIHMIGGKALGSMA